jgi:hypothetical protein
MSGGAYDYWSYQIDHMVDKLDTKGIVERRKFRMLLGLVSRALHDIEWVDSGDFEEGAELKAINKCLNFGKTK